MQTPAAHSSSHDIPVRKPGFEFDSVPRYWLHDNIAATHFFNGLNLLFPDGERFFVKAVYDRLDRIDDPVLRAQAKGFAGQEGQHANQHEKYFTALRRHGYNLDTFLRWYHRFYLFTSRWLPAPLRLSITAAAEHYTATFGANAIEDEELLAGMHPTMRKLIVWHATEEIEHKAVAFDVLKATHPSYLLRMLGFLIATLALFGWSLAGARMLTRQDGVPRHIVKEHRRRMFERNDRRAIKRLRAATLAYLRPGFHPNETDDLEAARRRLAQVGLPVAA